MLLVLKEEIEKVLLEANDIWTRALSFIRKTRALSFMYFH
jgi:hypothetical protein